MPEPSNTEDHEQTIEDMLSKISMNSRMGRASSTRPQANQDAALLADIANGRETSAKDDFSIEHKVNEYGDNQFWKKPEMYDIDDLLADMEDGS